MKVELIGWYGGDVAIARAAWTSTQIDVDSKSSEDIRDLLVNKLWNNGSGKPHKCYDDETEILTEFGWKLFKNLDSNIKVCAVNPINHNFEFEIPSEIVSFEYNEPMYYVKTQQIDLAVTKGHRMLVSTTKNKNYGKIYEIKTVEEIQGKTVKYLNAAKNNNKINLLKAENAKFIGFFIGDGNITKSLDIRFHLKKQRKIDYLKSLGFNILEQKNNSFIIRDKEFAKFLLNNCYDNGQKCLPQNFIEYSHEDVINIIDGLKNSDGSIKRNTFVYSTVSEKLKDQLQILACLNNFNFSASVKIQNEKPIYILNYSNRTTPEVINQPSRMYGNTIEQWKDYSGKVYCVTVSTGLIIVRRNGKVCICGNTPFERGLVEFNITCDQASHIHLLKHRLANINGECLEKDSLIYFEDKLGKVNRKITVKDLYDKFTNGRPHQNTQKDLEYSQKRIKNLRVRVLNEDTNEFEYSHIKDVWKTESKKIFKITLSDGKYIMCSDTHPFLTSTGYRSLKEGLSKGDKLGCNGITINVPNKLWTFKSFFEGSENYLHFVDIVNIEFIKEEECYDIEILGKYKNFVSNGIVTHNSARYKELKEDKFYLPEDWKDTLVDKKHHNMNYVNTQVEANWGSVSWMELLDNYTRIGNALYHKALEDLTPILGRKRAKESARYFKTMNSEITLSVMMNMSCFHNFYTLRSDDAAQKEIQWISNEMLHSIGNIPGNPFKYTLEAWDLK